MLSQTEQLASCGLEVIDLAQCPEFAERKVHQRDSLTHLEGVRRLASAFVERPDNILQELVDVAKELTGADSAAISVVRDDGTDAEYYHWVASSGVYQGFMDAMLPRYPSACGVCLERGRPQMLRVNSRFFDILGVKAAEVTDGLLFPWDVDGIEGTIFVLAHGRSEAFDAEDAKLMETLSDFAAMGVRQLNQREKLIEQTRLEATIALAHELAHEINNPLQSIVNNLFIAANGGDPERGGSGRLAAVLGEPFERLRSVSKRLLELPRSKHMRNGS